MTINTRTRHRRGLFNFFFSLKGEHQTDWSSEIQYKGTRVQIKKFQSNIIVIVLLFINRTATRELIGEKRLYKLE